MAAIKLFVWDAVLGSDYSEGMACAVATSPASARAKILAAARKAEDTMLESFEAELARDPSRVLDFREGAVYCPGGG